MIHGSMIHLKNSIGWLERAITLVVLLLTCQVCAAQSTIALSPDGKRVTYSYHDGLWLVQTDGSEAPKKIADVRTDYAMPRWSPSGGQLAYYRADSGSLQLWMYDPTTHASRQISNVPGGIEPNFFARFSGDMRHVLRYSWSPDGRKIVFASQVPMDVHEALEKGIQVGAYPSPEEISSGKPVVLNLHTPIALVLQGVVSYRPLSNETLKTKKSTLDAPGVDNTKASQLFILDVNSGAVTQLTHDTDGYFSPEWAPKGSKIAYMSLEGRSTLGYGPNESNIYLIDANTGQKTRLTQGVTQKAVPVWSTDGRSIAYSDADRRQRYVRGRSGVSVIDVDRNSPTRFVTDKLNRTLPWIGVMAWADRNTSIYFLFRDGLAITLAAVDVHTGAITRPTAPSTVSFGFDVNPKGITWTQQVGPNTGIDLMFSPAKGQVRKLAEITPTPDLRQDRRYETLTWTSKRGDQIDGLLIYPRHYVASRVYPLVVDAYGGSFTASYGDDDNLMNASEDYFYFLPNHRAPHMWMNSVKSPEYDAAAVGPTGAEVMADDILSGVDSLMSRADINAERMCLVGFSNGGLEGEQLLTQTRRFKCAVLQSPATSDWLTAFFLSTDDWAVVRYMHDVEPWQFPSVYTAASPLYQADKIETPLLMAVGDLDGLVLPTVEMYNALRYLKKDVTLLRYVDQGHVFSGAADADFTRRAKEFLAQYLGPSGVEH